MHVTVNPNLKGTESVKFKKLKTGSNNSSCMQLFTMMIIISWVEDAAINKSQNHRDDEFDNECFGCCDGWQRHAELVICEEF